MYDVVYSDLNWQAALSTTKMVVYHIGIHFGCRTRFYSVSKLTLWHRMTVELRNFGQANGSNK